MLPNTNQYKIITIQSKQRLGFNLKTTYTTKKKSIFDFDFFSDNSDMNKQKYPIVCYINPDSEAYKNGIRVGHTITKINDISLQYKDVYTVLLDFQYEKTNSTLLNLTIF